LKRHFAARHAQLWWGYPPCRLAPNKHNYFTILQIVESAFRMLVMLQTISDMLTVSLVLCWPTGRPFTVCAGKQLYLVHSAEGAEIPDRVDSATPSSRARWEDGLETRP